MSTMPASKQGGAHEGGGRTLCAQRHRLTVSTPKPSMSSSDEEGSVEFELDPWQKEWAELSAEEQKAAAVLGGGEFAWPPGSERTWPTWAELTEAQRLAATTLGQEEEDWPPEAADSDEEQLGWGDADDDDEDSFATSAHEEAQKAKRARAAEAVPEVQALAVDGQAYSPGALKSIASELKYMAKTEDASRGWRGGPMGDNVGQWTLEVPVEAIPQDLALAADMKAGGHEALVMHMIFPPDYPFRPPFMRVVRPRFAFRTGHVTIGGSICIELLTNGAWNPLYRLEGVMTHVLSTIYGEPGDPPARLDNRNRSDYSTSEAMDAFKRLLGVHGWDHWLKAI